MAFVLQQPAQYSVLNLDNVQGSEYMFRIQSDFSVAALYDVSVFENGDWASLIPQTSIALVGDVAQINLTQAIAAYIADKPAQQRFILTVEDVQSFGAIEIEFFVTQGVVPVLQFVKEPANLVFAGNPVNFTVETGAVPKLDVTVTVNDTVTELEVFTYYKTINGEIRCFADFDISDVLSENIAVQFDNTKSVQVDTDNDFNFRFDYSVEVSNTILAINAYGQCMCGGLPPADAGIDFASRDNFAFSNRGNSKNIYITRKELAPLFFINPEYDGISLDSDTGHGFEIQNENGELSVYGDIVMLNLPKIVREWEAAGDKIRWLAIGKYSGADNDVFSAMLTFNIEERAALDSYLIEFKNSFGVMERLEINGRATAQPEIEEGNEYLTLNEASGEYDTACFRRVKKDVWEAALGYKTIAELVFIGDLLMSDEIYLINEDGSKSKVLVTSSDYEYSVSRQIAPETLTLHIEFLGKSKYVLNNKSNDLSDNGVPPLLITIFTNSNIRRI